MRKQMTKVGVLVVVLAILTAYCPAATGGVLYTVGYHSVSAYDTQTSSKQYWGVSEYNTAVAADSAGGIWTLVTPGGSTQRALHKFDPLTGTSTLIGPTLGVWNFSALDFAPDGTLYGASDNLDSGAPWGGPPYCVGELYNLNTSTGAATVNKYILSDQSAGVSYSLSQLTAMAVDSQGNVYLAGTSHNSQTGKANLYSLDLETGLATYLGQPFGTTSSWIWGLAFDDSDTLHAGYGDDVYTVDLQAMTATDTGYRLGYGNDLTIVSSSVPEPTSLALWSGLGVMGLIAARRRRKQVA